MTAIYTVLIRAMYWCDINNFVIILNISMTNEKALPFTYHKLINTSKKKTHLLVSVISTRHKYVPFSDQITDFIIILYSTYMMKFTLWQRHYAFCLSDLIFYFCTPWNKTGYWVRQTSPDTSDKFCREKR